MVGNAVQSGSQLGTLSDSLAASEASARLQALLDELLRWWFRHDFGDLLLQGGDSLEIMISCCETRWAVHLQVVADLVHHVELRVEHMGESGLSSSGLDRTYMLRGRHLLVGLNMVDGSGFLATTDLGFR